MQGDTLEKRFEIGDVDDYQTHKPRLLELLESAAISHKAIYVEVWKCGEERPIVLPFVPASGVLGSEDI